MIPASAWFIAPAFAFFWLYKGFGFGKSVLFSMIFNIIVNSFRYLSLIEALFVTFAVLGSLWTYGNAKRNGIKFAWLYSLLSLIFPVLGLLIYLLVNKIFSVITTETIKTDKGKIVFNK